MNSGKNYDYSNAGFDGFLSRSIDSTPQLNLDSAGPMSRSFDFDRGAVAGAFPDTVRIGSIQIDGVNGRISGFEGDREAWRLGELDG